MRYLFFLALLTPLHAVEIATGKMLGETYDQRSFYVRHESNAWQKTYSGKSFKPQAQGRLMNLRLAQAFFHDEYLTEVRFDPKKHAQRYVDALDTYKRHGILAVSASMQGGNMQYDRDGTIKRDRPFKLGPGKGSHVSGFRSDGSLKPEWLARLSSLQKALDKRGMILNLLFLYGHQDELFDNPQAIDSAIVNMTDWLIDNDCRNVIIEIANEYDGGAFDHDKYITRNMGKLIQLARSRFSTKKARFRLPISASTLGGKRMQVYPEIIEHGDLTIIHGNSVSPEDKRTRVADLVKDPKIPGPVYMNEDNNGRETTPEILKQELASCDAVFESGGSWGYMPWIQAQIWPFRIVDPAQGEDRDTKYFRAVLEHIRSLVMQ